MKKIIIIIFSLIMLTACSRKKVKEEIIDGNEMNDLVEIVELEEEVELEEMEFDLTDVEKIDDSNEVTIIVNDESKESFEIEIKDSLSDETIINKTDSDIESDTDNKTNNELSKTSMSIDENGVIHLPVVDRE